jgi:hypothetical protein
MPEPLSIWNFMFYMAVWLALVGALFNALIGILGINAVKPDTTKRPNWAWIFLGVGILTAVGSGWQTARQLQESDLQKRIADSQRDESKRQFDSVTSKLDGLTKRNADTNEQLQLLAKAGNVPIDQSPQNIVSAIIAKLSKENSGPLIGKNSGSVVGGKENKVGIVAGQDSKISGNQIHIGDNVYINSAGNRTIPDAVRQKITDELKKAGSFDVQIIMVDSTAEVQNFGEQIHNVFEAAGWHAPKTIEMGGPHGGEFGLKLGVMDPDAPPSYAFTVLKAFNDNGVKLEGAHDLALKDRSAVVMVVGGKP